MVRGPAFLVVVPDKRREIVNPRNLVIEPAGIVELEDARQMLSQRAERLAYDVFVVGHEEEQIVCFGVESLAQELLDRGGEEFLDAAGELLGFDLDPGATLAAAALDNVRQF